MPEVIVLFEGYAKELDNGKMDANCSCTLIKGEKNIIVDTMTAWDRDKIIDALAANGLKPDDINFVICTHSHADHIGNNNLFTNAEAHLIGTCVHRGTIFEKDDEHYNIDFGKGVEVIETEGHTHDDVSVVVKTKIDGKDVRVAIVGDLFERQEDIDDPSIWRKMAMDNLWREQIRSRFSISAIADYIVPGHGPMFELTQEMKKTIGEYLEIVSSVKEGQPWEC